MSKSNLFPLAATLASLFVCLWTDAHAANRAPAIDKSLPFSATSHFASTVTTATKTTRVTTKGAKSARKGKLAYLRLLANRRIDRLGRLAHGRTMNDDVWTGASWDGRMHGPAIWSAPTALSEPNTTSGEPAFGPGNSQPGLADRGTDAPTLLPPGRESNYKVSFNLPVGRNESINVQAGVRKNVLNIPGSNDPSLRAAWSMKF
jgi:hypothetical protein